MTTYNATCTVCNTTYTSESLRCPMCKRSWDQEVISVAELPVYSQIVTGVQIISQQVVCNSGKVHTIRAERYADGYHAFLIKEDGTYTNHTGYKTARKAINAIAKLS